MDMVFLLFSSLPLIYKPTLLLFHPQSIKLNNRLPYNNRSRVDPCKLNNNSLSQLSITSHDRSNKTAQQSTIKPPAHVYSPVCSDSQVPLHSCCWCHSWHPWRARAANPFSGSWAALSRSPFQRAVSGTFWLRVASLPSPSKGHSH